MAFLNYTANSGKEAVQKLLKFITDDANLGVGLGWQMLQPAAITDFDENHPCILKGVGDGEDEIYVGLRLDISDDGEQADVVLNGYAGYDDGLEWDEQPGCIYHDSLPILPLAEGTRLLCWVQANSSRFIFVIQESTQYEAAYIGFIQPVAIQRQYPYPLLIGASHHTGGKWTDYSDAHSIFTNPGGDGENTTLRLRRSDGCWIAGANKGVSKTAGKLLVWPQSTEPKKILTVLDPHLTVENVCMLPMMLYECGDGDTDPTGIVGQMDGIYFIGNREDISSKDTLIYEERPYMVFNNVNRRDNDEYFAVLAD